MVKLTILKLQRSSIGLSKGIRDVIQSLGLGKRHSIAYCEANPVSAGKIFKVKELVSVNEVENKMSKYEERKARAPPSGFTVVNRRFPTA
ncbi:ribosomal protein subunit YmL33 [Schizosaccharomyces cryophilus OY26]|uniref:Large ribosomal subunit protein uL30m n=1 Tax=Schizosaccharomyces cryophilus (strain OY26 / ATCC MYA-4695 / CBS 11777 / NBRC 106824 / NRRL Y48691) TaxID=653667 RepID=S9XBH8_SCHCR|nr:ribosomal protein subunit YmL33 [Schizosaccharomyces cryophilus OY26]EPY51151.1 ribosomal protein subunit YmL33 [Schizosaccharomyces cryophilus OY26]